MSRRIIIMFVLSTLLISACSSASASETLDDLDQKISVVGGEYTDISVSELQTMLENKDFIFINVHIPFAGDIPQTDLSIPFNEIEANIDQLPKDKESKIVVYCRSGSMSSEAASTLVGLGYTNVWNLSGGFNAWENAELPLEGK